MALRAMEGHSLPTNSADPILPDEVVLSIVRRYAPSVQRLSLVDESGRKGRAYFIDENIVLKTQRPARLRARVIEEFETNLAKEAVFL
jgi:hygromycin-B 7''-O-kinase